MECRPHTHSKPSEPVASRREARAMEWLLYSILQGLLEWLPVSSSGVLVLTGLPYREALGVHLATGAAGLAYLAARRRLSKRLLLAWGVAPLATGAPVALLAERLASSLQPRQLAVLTLTLYTVTIAALAARLLSRRVVARRREPNPVDIAVLGVLEGVAALPGVSRSGVTAAYLAARGYEPRTLTTIVIASGAVAGLAAGLYEALHGAAPPLHAAVTVFAASIPSAYILEKLGEKSATLLSAVIIAGLLAGAIAALKTLP